VSGKASNEGADTPHQDEDTVGVLTRGLRKPLYGQPRVLIVESRLACDLIGEPRLSASLPGDLDAVPSLTDGDLAVTVLRREVQGHAWVMHRGHWSPPSNVMSSYNHFEDVCTGHGG